MPSIFIQASGTVRAQPRGRAKAMRNKSTGKVVAKIVSTTGNAKVWKQVVERRMREAAESMAAYLPLTGPIKVTLEFHFETNDPARWGKWRTAHQDRDIDNNQKLIFDCAVGCGLLKDDGQIAWCDVIQVWTRPGNGGMTCLLEMLDDNDWVSLGAESRADKLAGIAEAPHWLE